MLKRRFTLIRLALNGREEVVLTRGFTKTLDRITVNNALSQGWKVVRSRHPGGANALFGDGSVHFANYSIDSSTWAVAGTRAGGEANAFPF